MLFKKNGKSFQFCILGVDDERHVEISRLIEENGGEIRNARCPPVIAFADRSNYSGEQPVFDVEYIYDCVKCGRLLDLMLYKLGAPGYYGCLMSIFTRGSNLCVASNDRDRRYESTIIVAGEQDLSINNEHNYARGDRANGGRTDALSILRPSTPSSGTSEVTSLPEKTARNVVVIPNGTTEFPPCETPRSVESSFVGPTLSSQSLPDRSSQDTHFTYSEMSQAQDFECNESTQNSQSLSDRSSQDTHITSSEMPQTQDFEPSRSTQNSQSLSDGSSQDTHITSSEMLQLEDFESNGLTQNSQVSPHRPLEVRTIIPDDPSSRSDSPEKHSSDATEINQNMGINENDSAVEVQQSNSSDELSHVVKRQKLKRSNDNHAASSILAPKKSTERPPVGKAIDDSYPIAGRSKTVVSPTILRDRSNRIKIIGGTTREEMFRKIDEFQIDSTDSETEVPNSETEISVRNRDDTIPIDEIVSIDDGDSDSSWNEVVAIEQKSSAAKKTTKSTSNKSQAPKRDPNGWKNFPPTRKIQTWETRLMIQYLINEGMISEGKGLKVWDQMIAAGHLVHRTSQSLNNHFRRYILPNLNRYEMRPEDMRKFQRLVN